MKLSSHSKYLKDLISSQSEENTSKSPIFDGTKSSTPREVLKGYMKKANKDHKQEDGQIQPTSNSKNELHQVYIMISLMFRK